MAQVKFFTCTQEQYDAKKAIGVGVNGLSEGALYFTTDTKRLFREDVLYGGSFEYLQTIENKTGVANTLYYNASDDTLKIWNGTAFVTKFSSDETLSGNIDAAISAAIQTLDADEVGGSGKIVTTISEADGIISATAIDLTTTAVARTATTNVGGATAEAALEDLGSKIATLNSNDETAGSVAKAVKDAKDALSGAIGATAEFDSTNSVKKYIDDTKTAVDNDFSYVSGVIDIIKGDDTTAGSFKAADKAISGAIGGTYDTEHTVADAIAALDASAISISGAEDNAIAITSEGTGGVNKTIELKINGNDKFLSQTSDGLSATFTLKKVTTGLDNTIAAEYYIEDKNGNQVGDKISITKDQFLKSAQFVQGSGSADDKLQLTFNTSTGTENVVDIPLSGLFDEYVEGDGIVLTPTSTGIEIKGVIDSNSENFLTVSSDGFKLTGVQNAIDAGDEALSGAIGTDPLSGEFSSDNTVVNYIKSKIDEEDSKLTGILAVKLGDVDANKSGQIITAKADGKVETSGKSIGGGTLAATPDSDTVATEAAVNAAITGALVWNTLS